MGAWQGPSEDGASPSRPGPVQAHLVVLRHISLAPLRMEGLAQQLHRTSTLAVPLEQGRQLVARQPQARRVVLLPELEDRVAVHSDLGRRTHALKRANRLVGLSSDRAKALPRPLHALVPVLIHVALVQELLVNLVGLAVCRLDAEASRPCSLLELHILRPLFLRQLFHNEDLFGKL